MTLGFWLSRAVCNLLSSLYPAYASYKAVLSGDPESQRQWLSFWVVNTIFTAFELFADRLISWMPLYWEAKILFVCWLTLPAFRGASVLYHSVVQRYLEHYEPDIDRHLEAAGAKIGEIADGVRGTVALHVRQKSGLIFSAASQLVADAAAAAASAGSGSGAPGSGSAAAAPGQQHAVQPKRNSIGSQQRKGRSPKS